MSWDPVKDAKKWINSIKNEGNSAINSVKNAGSSAVNQVKNTGNDVVNQAKKEIYKVKDDSKDWLQKEANSIKDNVEKDINKVKDDSKDWLQKEANVIKEEITEKLPELMKDEAVKALEAAKREAEKLYGVVSEQAFKAGIKLAHGITEWIFTEMKEYENSEPEIVAELNEFGGGFGICGIKFNYSGFYKRCSVLSFTLMQFSEKPPEFRRKPFLDFIEAIGPDSIEAGLEASASFVVFQSQNASISAWVDKFRIKLFLLAGDKLLKKLGVPE